MSYEDFVKSKRYFEANQYIDEIHGERFEDEAYVYRFDDMDWVIEVWEDEFVIWWENNDYRFDNLVMAQSFLWKCLQEFEN